MSKHNTENMYGQLMSKYRDQLQLRWINIGNIGRHLDRPGAMMMMKDDAK